MIERASMHETTTELPALGSPHPAKECLNNAIQYGRLQLSGALATMKNIARKKLSIDNKILVTDGRNFTPHKGKATFYTSEPSKEQKKMAFAGAKKSVPSEYSLVESLFKQSFTEDHEHKKGISPNTSVVNLLSNITTREVDYNNMGSINAINVAKAEQVAAQKARLRDNA